MLHWGSAECPVGGTSNNIHSHRRWSSERGSWGMDVGTGLSTTGVCCHNINDLFINNHSVGCLAAQNLQNGSFCI